MKIGLPGSLLCIFIVLKLIGYISWPWIWVLAPAWIPLGFTALITAMILVATGFIVIIGILEELKI